MVTLSEFKTWLLPKLIISYTFIATGLIINAVQFATWIFIWPFNKILYKRLNYYLAYVLYSNMTCVANYWAGMDLELYCTDEDFKALGEENCYCVCNHKYDIDWLLGWLLCQRVKLLGGAKVVLKDVLKYIPVLGWSWAFSEYIFVKRVWDKDHKTLVKDLNSILEYPKDLHYGINIFCESTRFTKEKHEASMKIAQEKGLPILKHHLLPRPKGFQLVASQMKGHVDYLYDINFAAKDVDGKQPTLAMVHNGVPIQCQILYRRIPMAEVPVTDEKECATFLNKVYKEKDDIFDVFHREGSFKSLGYKKQHLPRNGYDLIVGLCSLALVFLPSAYYVLSLLWSGSWIFKLSFFFFLITVNWLANWMIDKSNSKKSSRFGLSQGQNQVIDANNNTLHNKKDK